MMALNMSPETILDTMADVDVDMLLDGDRTRVMDGYSLAANGSMYKMDKQGFLPALMHYYYNQRKVEKKHMLALKQQLEETRSTLNKEEIRQLENRIATSYSIQMALKIALNSAYGATANKGFRFFDTRIAEGITMTGQLIIQNTERRTNKMMNRFLGNAVEKNYVIACDTDSEYVDMEEFVEKFCAGKTLDQKLQFMTKVCDDKIQHELNKFCDDLSEEMNWNKGVINFKREAICSCFLGEETVSSRGEILRVDELFSKYSSGVGDISYPDGVFIDTPHGEQEVYAVIKNTKKDILYEIETDDGILRLTEDHVIPVERDGNRIFIKVKDILESDAIYLTV